MRHPQLVFDSREHWEVEYAGGGRRRRDVGVIKSSDVRWRVAACFFFCLRGGKEWTSCTIVSSDWPACHKLSFKNTPRHAGLKLTTCKQPRVESNGQPLVVSVQPCTNQTREKKICKAFSFRCIFAEQLISLLFLSYTSLSVSLSEYSCVVEIQEVMVYDWSPGARSGWTGSSVVGVH